MARTLPDQNTSAPLPTKPLALVNVASLAGGATPEASLLARMRAAQSGPSYAAGGMVRPTYFGDRPMPPVNPLLYDGTPGRTIPPRAPVLPKPVGGLPGGASQFIQPPEYPQVRVRPAEPAPTPVGTYPGVTGVVDALRNRKVKNAEAADYADGGMVESEDEDEGEDEDENRCVIQISIGDGKSKPKASYACGGMVKPGRKKGFAAGGPVFRDGNTFSDRPLTPEPSGRPQRIANPRPMPVPVAVPPPVRISLPSPEYPQERVRPAPVDPGPPPDTYIGLPGVVDAVRNRKVKNAEAADYACGGAVKKRGMAAGGMVRFAGRGGPRDDQIPVKVAGAEINVSDGENAVILPAKTAANPAAIQAIEGIIQATNDGRQPKAGIEAGGEYGDGLTPYERARSASMYRGELATRDVMTARAAEQANMQAALERAKSQPAINPRAVPAQPIYHPNWTPGNNAPVLEGTVETAADRAARTAASAPRGLPAPQPGTSVVPRTIDWTPGGNAPAGGPVQARGVDWTYGEGGGPRQGTAAPPQPTQAPKALSAPVPPASAGAPPPPAASPPRGAAYAAGRAYGKAGGASGIAGKALNVVAPAVAAYQTLGDNAITVQGLREGEPGYDEQAGAPRAVAAAKEVALRAGDWGTKGLDVLGGWALPSDQPSFNDLYRERVGLLPGVTAPTTRDLALSAAEQQVAGQRVAQAMPVPTASPAPASPTPVVPEPAGDRGMPPVEPRSLGTFTYKGKTVNVPEDGPTGVPRMDSAPVGGPQIMSISPGRGGGMPPAGGPVDAYGNSTALTTQLKGQLADVMAAKQAEQAQSDKLTEKSNAWQQEVRDRQQAERNKWEREVAASSILNRPDSADGRMRAQATLAALNQQAEAEAMRNRGMFRGQDVQERIAGQRSDADMRQAQLRAQTDLGTTRMRVAGDARNTDARVGGELEATGMRTASAERMNTETVSERKAAAAAHDTALKEIARANREGTEPKAYEVKNAAGQTTHLVQFIRDANGQWQPRRIPVTDQPKA